MNEKSYKPILIDSVKVAEDIVKQRFIGFDGKYCMAGAKAYGVSDVGTDAGQYAPVAISGILLVEAGGPIAAGTAITSDNEGKAVSITGTVDVNGYALDSATIGQVIRIVRGI